MPGLRPPIPIRGASLEFPVFFPSVSSLKARLIPAACIDLLARVGFPQFLLSAYDFTNSERDRDRIGSSVDLAGNAGAVVLLDSGNYEGFWYQDAGWDIDHFEVAAARLRTPLTFAFDVQEPPQDRNEHIELLVSLCLRSQEKLPATTIVPIVHAASPDLPWVVREVAAQLRPLMIAVPERALGDGIIERGRVVKEIRDLLGDLGTPLHLLGTGDPISIAVYSACGADSFDGLEWCYTAVRHDDATLHHLSHYPLLIHETASTPGSTDLVTEALISNLVFFGNWMRSLHSQIVADQLPAFVLDRVSSDAAGALRRELPDVFA